MYMMVVYGTIYYIYYTQYKQYIIKIIVYLSILSGIIILCCISFILQNNNYCSRFLIILF